jgi:hypothetical protein
MCGGSLASKTACSVSLNVNFLQLSSEGNFPECTEAVGRKREIHQLKPPEAYRKPNSVKAS